MSKVAFVTHLAKPKAASVRKVDKKAKALAVFLAGRNGKAKRSDIDYKIGHQVMEIKDSID